MAWSICRQFSGSRTSTPRDASLAIWSSSDSHFLISSAKSLLVKENQPEP